MKKENLKPAVKAAKKATKDKIEQSLVTELKKVLGELGHSSKALEKKIIKSSKKLAKTLAKDLKIAKEAIAKPVAAIAEKVAPAPTKAAPAKPAAKPAAPKAAVKPAVAKK